MVKDLVFVGLCVWIVTIRRPLAVIVGVLGLFWYGRDAWFQAKALWQEKHYRPRSESAPAQSAEDGKITVSPDAKEVDFEKE